MCVKKKLHATKSVLMILMLNTNLLGPGDLESRLIWGDSFLIMCGDLE